MLRVGFFRIDGIKNFAQIEAEPRLQQACTKIDLLAINRKAFVKPAAHVDFLRALARKKKSDLPLQPHRIASQKTRGRPLRDCIERTFARAGNDNSPMIENAPSRLQREGRIGDICFRMTLQMIAEALRRVIERGIAPRGKHQ
jgi:hypothetical protein